MTGTEGRLAFNDWVYNGWGNKYPSYEADDKVAEEIASLLVIPVFEPGIVLEGGSIDVNGQGLCLTTEQCLVNPNRNPHLAKEEIEEIRNKCESRAKAETASSAARRRPMPVIGH